ncbi:Probable galacturonosyltransferase 7 [Linum perenne]
MVASSIDGRGSSCCYEILILPGRVKTKKGGGGVEERYMKGVGASAAALGYPAKRRWRCLATGVLFLVLLSMLVPLVFLLGLYNGFHSTGYISDQQSSSSTSDDLGVEHGHNISDVQNHSERDTSSHVDKVIKRLVPVLPTDPIKDHPKEEKNGTIQRGSSGLRPGKAGLLRPPTSQKLFPGKPNKSVGDGVEAYKYRSTAVDQRVRLCELSFGSYCLWLEENREDMKDFMVKKLKDKLFVARAYFPSIAKLPAQSNLSHELKQNIQDLERILSESSTDTNLPPFIEKKLQRMDAAISKAQLVPLDCSNVDKKLRQIFDLTEDEANFHMKQSAFLYQLAVQTMPKSLHCLLMRLTVEYFKSSLHATKITHPEKYSDPLLQHYVILSTNVLASSVVINSTVFHAKESGNLAFHVLTDAQNYFAMKLWFLRNMYKKAVVEVINIEDLSLDKENLALSSLSLPVEFRVTFHSIDSPSENHLRTEYLSVFSDSHYLLPYIFPKLKKIVVLDDDVVVQRDLTELWNLRMGGKVLGASQLCSVQLAELSSLFGDNSFDRNSCTWMSGLNVVDLDRWKELGLTKIYQKFSREQARGTGSAEAAALRGSLLASQDMIYPLDDSWVLSGLGHEYGFDLERIKNAGVLHYNGNLKPWLELGIPKYKHHWQRFLNREDQFLAECNVNS